MTSGCARRTSSRAAALVLAVLAAARHLFVASSRSSGCSAAARGSTRSAGSSSSIGFHRSASRSCGSRSSSSSSSSSPTSLILFGPLLAMNLTQVRGFEPGDAEWGVSLADVRGQAEAKEEVRRVVSLWQSGEAFEEAGGKRERGLLFLGAPGTGKTMLAKAIATGFNSPFVSIPGSGFAATFIGIDAIVVRFVARKAKRLARKWGGTVHRLHRRDRRRRHAPAGAQPRPRRRGRHGLDAAGQRPRLPLLRPERRAQPERRPDPRDARVARAAVRRARAAAARADVRAVQARCRAQSSSCSRAWAAAGSLALNQLLVVMDGIDNPPFTTPRAHEQDQHAPGRDLHRAAPRSAASRCGCRRRARGASRSTSSARPTCPIERLDPALIRPGRMGRHVWFRTPTKQDRLDVFDLYLDKVGPRSRPRHARAPRGDLARSRTATRRR